MSENCVLPKAAITMVTQGLSLAALRLYLIALKNVDTAGEVSLPRSIVTLEHLGLSAKGFTGGRQELIDLGFLTLVEAPCKYSFHPLGAAGVAEKMAAERVKKAARIKKKERGPMKKEADDDPIYYGNLNSYDDW